MNNYGCKICLASLYSAQLTPPLVACSSAAPAAALDRICAAPLELGPSVSVPALRVRAASLPRVPVHQVRLPQEDGPQDGSSQLLRAHPEAQTHPQGVQPPGVLPAHVSIPWTCRGTSPSHTVTSRTVALASPSWPLQGPRTVGISCSVLLMEIFFL